MVQMSLVKVGFAHCTPCYEVGSLGNLGGQHLDRRDEWCRCHLSKLVLFVALHVMRLVLLALLEDNIWTEGMSGADVTCQSWSCSLHSML